MMMSRNVARQDIADLYRLVLDREAESEKVVNEKRRLKSAADVAFDMLKSDEFIGKNISLLMRMLEG